MYTWINWHTNLLTLEKFKFFNIEEERPDISSPWSNQVTDEQLIFHSDPFFAECRAYGRIYERSNGREIVVPCYGYMAIPADPAIERMFSHRFGITDWNRSEEYKHRGEGYRQPFRALVKKFVDSKITLGKPVNMHRNLKTLRAWGIFQRDVFARNYKNGLLVDFSMSWTDPHWMLSVLSLDELTKKKNSELYQFDEMIEDAGIKTRVKAAPNLMYRKKLRKRVLTSEII